MNTRLKNGLRWLLAALLLLGFAGYTNEVLPTNAFMATVVVYVWLLLCWIFITWVLKVLRVAAFREWRLSGVVLLMLLLGVEAYLRFVDRTYLDYTELQESPIRGKLFDASHARDHILPPTNDTTAYANTEFTHIRTRNDKGLYEKPIGTKRPSEIRFLCLGDSFTEGVGTEYDSSWVKQAEGLLRNKYPNLDITFINGGLSASDPFFQYRLLTDNLLQAYQPDWVIVMSNTSDMDDFLERGGMERYRTDGTIVFRESSWWYGAYRYSYIVRHLSRGVFKLTPHLHTHKQHQALANQGYAALAGVCQKFDSLARANNFGFAMVLHPLPHELQKGRAEFDGFETLEGCSQHSLNLFPYFRAHLPHISQEYYWPIDGHFKAKGYTVLASGVVAYLCETVPQFKHPQTPNHATANP